jgi:hypothetical protein
MRRSKSRAVAGYSSVPNKFPTRTWCVGIMQSWTSLRIAARALNAVMTSTYARDYRVRKPKL